MPRADGRANDELRPVAMSTGYNKYAEGSCLVELGDTVVICTASVLNEVPRFLMGAQRGWVTAEYAMLPASTSVRKSRSTLKPDSRGVEIQRIIGRVLRNIVRFDRLGETSIHLDCDVLEADGGTRTASITGAYGALASAIGRGVTDGRCARGALRGTVAAVSVGIVSGLVLLDLDYVEDADADVDMNVAMVSGGKFVEIQGTSERVAFDAAQLEQMLLLARRGTGKLMRLQRQAIRKGRGR